MTHQSKYGIEPFEKVTKAEFELKGLTTMKEAAHLQYKLLLLEPVLRAHVDFSGKTASIILDNPSKNTKKIAEAIKPVKAILKSKEAIDYDELVDKGYHAD